MHKSIFAALLVILPLSVLAAEDVAFKPGDDTGTNPVLVGPDPGLLPTVKIAKAVGWTQGAMPVAPEGFVVTPFATSLTHPRWLHVLPNGDVLVAESNAPNREQADKGIK